MEKKRSVRLLVVLLLVLLGALLFSVLAGRYSISIRELAEILWGRSQEMGSSMARTVLFGSRLPRIGAAVLIGCGLSMSGAAYQGIFRNPMVSPDLLGASAGAGFGAALGLLLGLDLWAVQLLAFGTGILAVLMAVLLSRFVQEGADNDRVILVLSGMVVGALFQALISLVKYVADPFDTMPSIAFWLMGGLTYVTGSDMLFLSVPVLAGAAVLYLYRWRIDLLSFGSDEAEAMGVEVKKSQGVIILSATFMTASCVAVGGMIGWVGLIVPHFSRMLAGPDNRQMLPCAALLGSIFLLLVDDAARCLFPQELPIGILTAMIGAPVFIGLLAKGRRGFL